MRRFFLFVEREKAAKEKLNLRNPVQRNFRDLAAPELVEDDPGRPFNVQRPAGEQESPAFGHRLQQLPFGGVGKRSSCQ